MALSDVVESFADEFDGDEDLNGPEFKYIFDDQSFSFQPAGAQVKGFNPLYTNSDLNGTDDQKTPDAGGHPIVGTYIKPVRFDWKMTFTSSPRTAVISDHVKNWVMFRLVWMLIYEFPRDDDDYHAMFVDLYETGSGTLTDHFLKPQYKQKVRVLYDCVHTVGDVLDVQFGYRRNPSQAGYIVPPTAAGANPGWVVPAMSSAAESNYAMSYGGHVKFLEGFFDLEDLQRQGASLWRDNLGELPNQIMPTLQCFVVLEDAYNYSRPVNGPSQANSVFLFSTRYTFEEK